jgi:hypothetical protein
MELINKILPIMLLSIMTLLTVSCKENKSNVQASSSIDMVGVDSNVTYPKELDSLINSSESSNLYQQKPLPSDGMSSNPNAVSNMPLYYEKGYETGYDDGEEDAVNENGWQASYDDSNSYKGKKKHQYEDGYEEGYEAGYDDNHEGLDD